MYSVQQSQFGNKYSHFTTFSDSPRILFFRVIMLVVIVVKYSETLLQQNNSKTMTWRTNSQTDLNPIWAKLKDLIREKKSQNKDNKFD